MIYQKSLNRHQLDLLEFLKKFDFKKDFFLSGGTCITVFYYPIRYSYDLDFFTYKEIDFNKIFDFINKYENTENVKQIIYYKKYDRRIFNIIYNDDFQLKVEFTKYFKPLYDLNFSEEFGIYYLSEKDLITDKLFVLHERGEIKDYFDFFILYTNFYTKISEDNLLKLIKQVYKKFSIQIHKNTFCKLFYEGVKKDYNSICLIQKDFDFEKLKGFYLDFARIINCL